MAISFPVIILALLVAGILGIAIGYSMAQKRFQQEADVLQEKNQKRLQAIETAHEQRLNDALFKARQDYEAQLSYRIGQYQDQLSQSLAEREQEHETRLEVWQQGVTASNGVQASSQPATAPEVMQLKHQYESRLKEAAQKLQRAYEQKLAQQSQAATHDLQQAYEAKLSQKITHYETQLAERVIQLESEFEARQAAITATVDEVAPEPEALAGGLEVELDKLPDFPQASPSEIMGTGNNEPTITLHRPFSLSNSDTAPAPEADLPDLNMLDALEAVPPASSSLKNEGELADSAEPKEQLLADLAELDDIPPLPEANNPDPLEDLADFSTGSQSDELEIEVEQLDSLDLDDIE
ncbi:MAG: hypothetical protein ACFB0C_10265 [Leptolyngbyaceae cyanobacterium]